MTLNISLSEDAAARLRERARACGQDLTELVTGILQDAAQTRTIDEVLADFRRRRSGTDEDLSELIEAEKEAARKARD